MVRTTLRPRTRRVERAVAYTNCPNSAGVATLVAQTAPRLGAAVNAAASEPVSPSSAVEPGALAVFKVVNYRRFVAGQSLSLIGSWTQTIAEGLLVWHVTHSSIVLGLVAATRYTPVLIGTPYAGLIVDRHDRRHMLMLTSTVLGVTSLAMGAAVLTHVIAIWMAFLSAAASGVMTCLDNPARMAFIPELVGTPLLRRAITTNSIMANVGRAVGPAVAAALVHFYGLGWCFVFNAASFGLVVVALLRLNTTMLHRQDRYELDGVDYPAGYVRWTERRNLGCFLDLIAGCPARGRLLVSGIRPIGDAADGLRAAAHRRPARVGFLLEYPRAEAVAAPAASVRGRWERAEARPAGGRPARRRRSGLGFVGAGNYATAMLLPHLAKHPGVGLASVATDPVAVGGQRPAHVRLRIERATDADTVLVRPLDRRRLRRHQVTTRTPASSAERSSAARPSSSRSRSP